MYVNAPHTVFARSNGQSGFNRQHPNERRRLDPRTEQALLNYSWPGNVRELKHAVERDYLTLMLERHGGHMTRAAEALGITRKTLWEKLRHLGVAKEGR
jgi:DNA-binding NtrC family response regulator